MEKKNNEKKNIYDYMWNRFFETGNIEVYLKLKEIEKEKREKLGVRSEELGVRSEE